MWDIEVYMGQLRQTRAIFIYRKSPLLHCIHVLTKIGKDFSKWSYTVQPQVYPKWKICISISFRVWIKIFPVPCFPLPLQQQRIWINDKEKLSEVWSNRPLMLNGQHFCSTSNLFLLLFKRHNGYFHRLQDCLFDIVRIVWWCRSCRIT